MVGKKEDSKTLYNEQVAISLIKHKSATITPLLQKEQKENKIK